MNFSQEYINSQINRSKSDIEKYQESLTRERKSLHDFLISQGYKVVLNLYVHPDYIEIMKERGRGYYGDLPEDKVFSCP